MTRSRASGVSSTGDLSASGRLSTGDASPVSPYASAGQSSAVRPDPDSLNSAVVLRRELIADGLSDSDIRAKVRRGELQRIRHGSYVESGFWASLSREDQHRVMVRAVLKRAHPSTVATHISSAVERGGSVWGIPLDEVHVTRTDGRPGRSEAGVVHHAGVLEEADVEILNGIRVSRAPRCAVELTTRCGVEAALVTVNSLLHRGELTVAEFKAAAHDMRYWPDSLSTTLVERLCDPRLSSVAESRTWYMCWAQHLPRPRPQVPVPDENGWVFAYADFGWEAEGVFLEFDGRIKYERYRREGETLEEYLLREKRREEQICLLTGWQCIRIQWEDLEHPQRTATRIRRILELRRGPRPA